MGVNGMGNGVSRRVFLGAGGLALAGLACGGDLTTAPQDPSNPSKDPLALKPARVSTVPLQQQGTLEFQQSHLIDMPATPAPAGVFVGGNEAVVVSALDMGGMPGMNGLFRFALPDANSTLAVDLGAQNQSYLNDVARLPDSSFVITTADGFHRGSAFHPFPSELLDPGANLLPGAAVFTDHGDTGTLWISASSFHRQSYSANQDPFLDSALLAYPVTSSGVDAEAVEIIPLSDQNATAIGLRNVGTEQQLLVLNSGNYFSSSAPSIDVIAAREARYVGTIELPAGMTMQTSPHLAVSEDGAYAFIGAGDKSGKVIKVGLDDGTVAQTIVEAAVFHSSVVLNGGFVFVTSYDWERSSLTVLDAEQLSHVATIDLQAGKAGSAAAYAGGVIQLSPHRAVFIEPVGV